MELPGQYTGRCAPQPETHVYVDSVADQMLVLTSKQLPKRINVRCSDQTERPFLIKGGEVVNADGTQKADVYIEDR